MGCHLFNTYCHCYTHNGRTSRQGKNATGENDFTLLRSFQRCSCRRRRESLHSTGLYGWQQSSRLKMMGRTSQLPVGGDSQRPEYRWGSAPVSATRDHRSPEGSCSESRLSVACSTKTCSEREKKTHTKRGNYLKCMKHFGCNQKYGQCSQGESSLSVSEHTRDVDWEIRWSKKQTPQ